MQIFAGACIFLVAVVVLAYLPGKLLLLLLNRKLSLLEDTTLACSVGLLISALAYWLIVFFRQTHLFVLWPLTITGFFVYLYARRWKRLLAWSRRSELSAEATAKHWSDKSGFVLAGVMALGVMMLALLPQYYSNLTFRADGTMRVRAIYDVFFHLAVANELTHSIPPQAPVFAGHLLSYHYGMDLAVAMFANATSLSIPDLTLRFTPTLFLALSMLSAYCFARAWLKSGFFAALFVFLVFFGEDFSFVPGLLLHEGTDWSAHFFSAPAIFSLFYNNAMLPAVGLLFAGLFCLQRYLREHSRMWLFLCAGLFVALVEVKLFTAAHIMCCLGLGAIVYRLVFKANELFKVAALTAVLTIPFVLHVFLHNKSGADFGTAFGPWPYVSLAMKAIGISNWSTSVVTFTTVALPVYLIGCLGLRVIGVPAILKAIFHPDRESGVRFVLASFVIIGAVVALTCRIVPVGSVQAYNNSVWFLAQSKYIAWIFAVEILQTWHAKLVLRDVRPALVTSAITILAVFLSVPATLQHFVRECDSAQLYGKAITADLRRYSREVLGATEFLTNNTHAGDVVLPDANLLGPVLALTKCRVPLGYYSFYLVSRDEFAKRESLEKEFWKSWRLGKVRSELLRETRVRYVIVKRGIGNIPSVLPVNIHEVFSNPECAVFKVTL
jgi:hypothetical protein